jgi:quinol monooxygenase YgiN
MELFIFGRFHARAGSEREVEETILAGLALTRAEPGCLSSNAFRSTRDPQLFFIHSRWKDEAAFEIHAEMPHTVRFLERIEPLIDHPLDVKRTERNRIGWVSMEGSMTEREP